MDNRYQVFVSSTYADLQKERQRVIQTLMEMDCIPAGMELFPAVDEEQWAFIKRIIDDCDYYILIIGGRYGSLTPEGISYTEKEYAYAISIGLKVLAFVHESPEEIPVGKSDIDPSLRNKLDEFRARVSKNRLVKFWKNATELPGLVALSLTKTIKLYPAVGWVRSNKVASNEVLIDINRMRKENEKLLGTIAELESRVIPEDVIKLASLEDTFEVTLEYKLIGKHKSYEHITKVIVTWAEMFSCIAPDLLKHPNDGYVNSLLGAALYRKQHPRSKMNVKLQHNDFQTVRTQFVAHDLITIPYSKTTKGGMELFWNLTKRGQTLMMQLRPVKSNSKEANGGDS